MRRLARRFVPVKIDGRAARGLVKEFGASWAGDLLVIDASRKVIEKFGDKATAAQVAAALEKLVMAGFALGVELARYVLAPRTLDDAGRRELWRHVDDLDADAFEPREAAFRRLLDAGPAAYELLRRAGPEGRSAEWRSRVASLLERMEPMEKRRIEEGLDRAVAWQAGLLVGGDDAVADLAHARLAKILGGLRQFRDGLPGGRAKLAAYLPAWWEMYGEGLRWNAGADRYEE